MLGLWLGTWLHVVPLFRKVIQEYCIHALMFLSCTWVSLFFDGSFNILLLSSLNLLIIALISRIFSFELISSEFTFTTSIIVASHLINSWGGGIVNVPYFLKDLPRIASEVVILNVLIVHRVLSFWMIDCRIEIW